ncbi:hypothetical protein EUBSIR_00830 [[Eubacterium] siraeum DSM 15702]|uniref:Uncharacterized protein n=1 Tax=[Eubacterium] siraeum DSM 15702 TaxID=428128 RepID=B0MLY2_9FIRM|nr:hypothetical protein EUBSIR_00830 [[Eubacterium] siraeum DSM 15702]
MENRYSLYDITSLILTIFTQYIITELFPIVKRDFIQKIKCFFM